MTLVAGFAPDNALFILLGDLLLSGKGQVDQNFRIGHNEIMLPSIGATEVRSDVFSGIRVGSLASKIAIINENLAFAWGSGRDNSGNEGDLQCASRLLSHIYQTAPKKIKGIECINDCLSSANYEDADRTKLIALFKTEDGRFCLHNKDADVEFHSNFLGDVFAAGSGSTQLKREFKHFLPENITDFSENPAQEGLMALAKAMIAAGHLLTRQVGVNAFIDQYFGGIFEIAYPGQYSIQKLDDLSFLFWTVDDDWQYLTHIPLTIHLSYIDDVLIVKRAEGFRADGLPISLDQRNGGLQIFCLQPIHRSVNIETTVEKISPRLNSTHQCHCIIGQNHGDLVGMYVPMIYGRQDAIKFEWHQGRLDFWIKQSFKDQLVEIVTRTSEGMKSRP